MAAFAALALAGLLYPVVQNLARWQRRLRSAGAFAI
jgi:hypothetical protein